jgi:CBS domain containing-hemolysin-like protein
MANSALLIIVTVLFVALAGLFSGAETGMYRLSRLRLRLGIERKRLGFVMLGKAMHDSPSLLLSMLVGTNLANYLAAGFVTAMLLARLGDEHAAEILATVITAPVLFIFSELIPKNLFFYRADSLMPFVSPVILAFHKAFTWSQVVPLLKGLSGLLARLTRAAAPAQTVVSDVRSSHIRAILRETREEGFFSPIQSAMVDRIIAVPALRIRSVMTPLSQVRAVQVNSTTKDLLEVLRDCPFTRLPVYEQTPDNIVGFVNIYEVLSSDKEFADLRCMLKPLPTMTADTAVINAIETMQKQRHKMVLVTQPSPRGREKPLGIVTMKDLVEEVLGELTEW